MALPQARRYFRGGLGLDVRTEGELEDALEKAAAEDGLVFMRFTPGGWTVPKPFAARAGRWQKQTNSTCKTRYSNAIPTDTIEDSIQLDRKENP